MTLKRALPSCLARGPRWVILPLSKVLLLPLVLIVMLMYQVKMLTNPLRIPSRDEICVFMRLSFQELRESGQGVLTFQNGILLDLIRARDQ